MTTTNQTPAQIVEALKVWNSNVAKTTVKLMNDYLASINNNAFKYKGFVIEEENEPWALKYGIKFKFSLENSSYEKVYNGKTIEQCKDFIDLLTYEIIKTSSNSLDSL